jgi:hypothetical protein
MRLAEKHERRRRSHRRRCTQFAGARLRHAAARATHDDSLV